MYITIQEQIRNFKKRCENTFEVKKVRIQGDIGIPIRALADSCVAFRKGERYLFAPKENADRNRYLLHILRINLLWQLARQGESVTVYGNIRQFEKDFLDLLAIESTVPKHHILGGFFASGEQKKLLESAEKINAWKIKWALLTDTCCSEDENAVCFLVFQETKWKQYWPRKTGKVVLGFLEENALNGKDTLAAIYEDYKLNFPDKWADYFILCNYVDSIDEEEHEKPCPSILCIDNRRLIYEEKMVEIDAFNRLKTYLECM